VASCRQAGSLFFVKNRKSIACCPGGGQYGSKVSGQAALADDYYHPAGRYMSGIKKYFLLKKINRCFNLK
jgi:hypothetical protein